MAFVAVVDMNMEAKSANGFATQVPLRSWGTKLTDVLWQVKWTSKGLTPSKPAVYSLMEIELLPREAVVLA